MTKTDNSGPAFPVVETEYNNGHPGMTLRDYFAGQWVAAGHHANLSAQEAAEQSYEFADAMIAHKDDK